MHKFLYSHVTVVSENVSNVKLFFFLFFVKLPKFSLIRFRVYVGDKNLSHALKNYQVICGFLELRILLQLDVREDLRKRRLLRTDGNEELAIR